MEKSYEIKNLGCAHCGGKIEEAINKLDGVEKATLNFPLRKLKVRGECTNELLAEMNELAGRIEAGVVIAEYESEKHEHCGEHEHHGEHCCAHEHKHHEGCCCDHEHHHDHREKKYISDNFHSHGEEKRGAGVFIPFVSGIVFFAAALAVHHFTDFGIISAILFGAAYILLGYNVLTATLKNIRAGNFFDENFLMTVATIGAFVLGEYAEAVGVVLFFKIGELFEDYAVSRSRKAITAAAELRVDEAEVLRNGEFKTVGSDEIEVGDILRIKAGERIAADGIVESGESRIDTSAVNGEPVPMTVRSGDKVMSGCINLSETLTLRATAAAADSMIAKIAEAVEEASAEKPKMDRFITRFSKVYTPIVIIAAVLTAVIGTLLTHDWEKWIYSALTFLVISCPCALVLSVPLAYFSGIGAASKNGILFKGGNVIEALGKIKAIVFDKTGTLTNGSFAVTEIKTFAEISEAELLKICGSCEQISSHPVAESISVCCKERDIALDNPERSGELAGMGVYAIINGKTYFCGNEKLMQSKGISIGNFGYGKTGSVVYVSDCDEILGRIIVSDSVKKTSAKTVSKLKSMGIYTAMLTGDKQENADIVGNELGIDRVRGGLMPDEKLSELNDIRSEKGAVMFVGDGINDAPVLAGADIGGAMQSGADLALEAADAVFMNSEPESIVAAKKIADKTLRISYQNIFFALAVKALVLILGILGHPNMWFAVFADSGTAMLLILNSIRALKVKK